MRRAPFPPSRPPSGPEAPAEAPRRDRILGVRDDGRIGPRVVVTAGVHGNEPAGTEAVRRVFRTIEEKRLPLRGSLLGLKGNILALEQGRRFVGRDLNRGWLMEAVRALLRRSRSAADPAPPKGQAGADGAPDAEDREQLDLLGQFARACTDAVEPVTFIDLHSTSAGGAPFVCISDTVRNRKLAFAVPVPVLLGLEENIEGTMASFLDDLGHRAVVFEGGQHDDPGTVDHHEAALWILLVAAGSLRRADVPEHERHRALLARAAKGLPHVLEIRYRHPVAPADAFRMRPGYLNFQKVAKGETLAADSRGEIRCRQDGRILMPLYQELGEDGFFIAREVSPFWLAVARALRRVRGHVLLPLLPGVAWHANRADTLLVNPRVARYFVVEIFHLFGYRSMMPEGRHFVFTRRRPDGQGILPFPSPKPISPA